MKVTACIIVWMVGMATGMLIGRAVTSCMPVECSDQYDGPVMDWIESADWYDRSRVNDEIIIIEP